ncbi:MAG: response regulator receiver protein [Desulfatitalea sp. BRH_c12]|nr:MAG: response regulator receiver protein [Desulfatitalea sp. BRH_c12]
MTQNILLVDDEEGIRKVLDIALTDRGFQVHSASDAHEALALFDTLHPPIVITDIKMPGMDGIALLRELKKRDADTEVIMITGHGDMDLAIQSLKYNATDYIAKPIDDNLLEVSLKRACERIHLRTQLREYTENLERLVEEKTHRLIHAERLAAMGETTAGLAHAIKNITGGLKGGVFVVEKGLSLNNRDYLTQGWRMVRDNVTRIEQLSLDLLDIAKPGMPRLEPTDPRDPLQAVYELICARAEQNNIRLRLACAQELPMVEMEADSIYRCLLNIVSNALDACIENDHCSEPLIDIGVTACADGIEYHVKDNCGGICEAVREKLFKAFITTKGSRGTGIGLMLSRKIVDMHQGSIQVTSQQGQGSAFAIRLPLTQKSRSQQKND